MDVLTLLVLFLPLHPKNKLLGFQGNPKNGARMDLAGVSFVPPTHLCLPGQVLSASVCVYTRAQ